MNAEHDAEKAVQYYSFAGRRDNAGNAGPEIFILKSAEELSTQERPTELV